MTSEILKSLAKVQSMQDLEACLQDIAANSPPVDDVANLITSLESFLLKADIVTTSKMRRRLTRLISSLSSPCTSSAGPSAAIDAANSGAELEAALNQLIVPSADDVEGVKTLCTVLEGKLSQNTLGLSRQLKRRMSRLLFVLNKALGSKTNCVQNLDGEESTDVVKLKAEKSAVTVVNAVSTNAGVEAKPALDSVDFQKWCSDIEKASTADILDECLTQYRSSDLPDDRSRVFLADILNKISLNMTIMSNSKIRRRVNRLLSSLTANSSVASEVVIGTGDAPPVSSALTSASDLMSENGMSSSKVSSAGNTPYVVFIGQLSFHVTASDIEEHLRSGGVEGNIKIRLSSDSASGKSKGVAFVELEGPRELHKSLGLHHTVLKGRRINVEKTCGGRNKQLRSQKIKVQRETQKVKASDDIDNIVKQFENSTAISIRSIDDTTMNRIYACTPSEVKDIFAALEQKVVSFSSEVRSLDILREIITEKDGGGHHVDQSRMLGYGSFKRKHGEIDSSGSDGNKKSRTTSVLTIAPLQSEDLGRSAGSSLLRGRGGKFLSSRRA